jgi:hypothetical protein
MDYFSSIFKKHEPEEELVVPIEQGKLKSVNYNNPEKIIMLFAHGCVDVNKTFNIPEDTSIHYLARPGFVSCVRLKENRTFKCVMENIKRNFEKTYTDFHKNLIKTYQKIYPYNSGLNENREVHDMNFEFHDYIDMVSWKMGIYEFTKESKLTTLPEFVTTQDFPNKTITDRKNRFMTNLPNNSILLERIHKNIEGLSSVKITITLKDIVDYFGSGVYIINTCAGLCESKSLTSKTIKDAWKYLITYYENNTVESKIDGYTYKMCDKFVPITKIESELLIQVAPEFRDIYIQNEITKSIIQHVRDYIKSGTLKKDMITYILCDIFDIHEKLILDTKQYASCQNVYDAYINFYKGQIHNYQEFFSWLSQFDIYNDLRILFHKKNLGVRDIINILLTNQTRQLELEKKSTILETKFSIDVKKQMKRKRKAYEEEIYNKKRRIIE